ncbi:MULTISPECIES: PAS domain S-box protein [unclassified Caballeronia]|uniref:PAS domain-containing hybrid sensor histidine kinase/response regulator n=1 Tax=unclassified Caballeronia TaxID=2646786 RepID=UPI00285A5394|nr:MULTISPECIES: PAS domain S-box protein [unclassified Caballeronia]MDR5754276.1 PAS domain S-box protein [Caballeronia sp. LZ024]MDR5840654.1 PAS domain S-box protein [Caballeronia sp. LZ031]
MTQPASSPSPEDTPALEPREDAEVRDSLYRTLVQEIEDYAIFMLDLEGRVRTWNAGAQKIKGYAAREIIGQHFSRFYPAEALARDWPAYELREALAVGRFEDEGWRVRKDGSLFWANVVITTMRDPDGTPIGFAKLTRDLTLRRQEEERLRQSEERFRLLVESVEDYAIFMLDPDGRVASWNAGAIEIKGYRPDEIIGQHFSVFYRPEDNAAGKPAGELARASRFGRVEDEGWRVRKDGSLFWANVIITAVYDSSGTLRGFAKVTRDLSERKRLEELERSSQHVSEFLATLAHELRNPLAPLRNAVGVMQLEPQLSPTIASCRDMIDRQTIQLSRLVDDLLDMGRITTGKIDLRMASVDMAEVVAQSVEAARPLADQRQQVIDVRLPAEGVVVEGDFVRLVQVLQNLLNNASKFSPTGGRIAIEIVSEARNIVLTVSDQGRGISPGSLDTIFTLFAQEDRLLDPTHNGLGIGLTLSRSLVELHGGMISAQSEGRGMGSVFTVRLPRARRRATRSANAAGRPSAPMPANAMRVLVIDDNRDSSDSLAMLIGMKGHEARAAYDGASGLTVAREFLPDLVLVDLAMPDMDGFAVLRALRANVAFARTVTAAMTGFGQNQDRERSIGEGFDAHLVKPVDMALLDALLADAKRRLLAAGTGRSLA